MFLAANVAVPEPDSLYTAVNVHEAPGVRPVISAVALARTALLPATRSEFVSEAATLGGGVQVAATDMKPAEFPVLPWIWAVRITSTFPLVGTVRVTCGPVVVRLP